MHNILHLNNSISSFTFVDRLGFLWAIYGQSLDTSENWVGWHWRVTKLWSQHQQQHLCTSSPLTEITTTQCMLTIVRILAGMEHGMSLCPSTSPKFPPLSNKANWRWTMTGVIKDCSSPRWLRWFCRSRPTLHCVCQASPVSVRLQPSCWQFCVW